MLHTSFEDPLSSFFIIKYYVISVNVEDVLTDLLLDTEFACLVVIFLIQSLLMSLKYVHFMFIP